MERIQALWLDVWREASRHLGIETAVETIARLVAGPLAVDYMAVLVYDPAAGVVRRQAEGWVGRPDRTGEARRELRAAEQRLVAAWLRGGAVVHDGDDQGLALLTAVVGPLGDRSWCAGPIHAGDGTRGALVVRGTGNGFDARQLRIFEGLLDPLSIALENDRRLHELNALREAAEADKRSALARLGREELVDRIVGSDGGLKPVMERVNLVARSDIPVLILGETGSGKELVARAIHERSARASGPFIRVNCGAIPTELIDSELFGHERGAFTGATTTRRGWFERADEGTLLLDEIGEMPLAAQVRLLRVLQEGVFERVGGERPVRVDVRVVAATHRDLPAMVQDGRFREDLWYRISAFPIVLPPLRERKQDIPALVEHMVRRAATRFGLKVPPVTPEDLALLAAYDWPGNVRELASVIDRAAILGDGKRLEIAKALGHLAPEAPAAEQERPAEPTGELETLDDAMRRHIETALVATRGRIEGPRGAAHLLNVNPHTLRARMRKLGIDWTRFR